MYVVWASHGDQSAASSSMHSNVTPGKSEENSNSAVVLSVASGGAESMKVSSECCVHSQRAGVASNMPNSFTARTRSTCSPGSRPSKSCSASHELHSGTGSSSEHSNVGASSVFDSDSKANSTAVLAVGSAGPELIEVSGTTDVVALAIAKADRLPGSPQMRPAAASFVVVTSTQALPSKWRSRTGSASAFGL